MRERVCVRVRRGEGVARELVREQIPRLARFLHHVPDDAAVLSVSLEGGAERKPVRARAALRLPWRVLAAQEEADRVDAAVRAVFSELERMLEREIASLRRERAWLRRGAGVRARAEQAVAARGADAARSKAALEQLVPFLADAEHYVRTELRMSVAAGEVALGELDPRDVLDSAVLRAVETFDERPREVSPRAWLLRIVSEELDRQLRALREEHEAFVHIEEDVPETPAEEEVVTLGSEIYDFYQPDEDLKLEDVLPAEARASGAEETAEVSARVLEALAALPRSWREAFLLRDVRGYEPEEVAWVTGVEAAEVSRRAERAAEFLRERIGERRRR